MRKITLLLLSVFGLSVQAQVAITTTETPVQLVQNVLIGQGVTPYNIKFNGNTANANLLRDQATHFTVNFNPTNLGFAAGSEGVLLSTGKGLYALGPNTSHNNLGTGQSLSATPNGTDPDLALLSGNTISSSAILEFDFVATGLELNFDFVFGSEEYAGYVNNINDSFGFFLSGYGINGPYQNNAKNIALVPNTNTQISINTINNGPNNNGACTNCAYYYNNGPTGLNPNNSSIETVEYDGFTTVLRATSALRCGEVYHIKLAIGNVSDNWLDSGVFLKNFRIKPMELLDDVGLSQNTSVCDGKKVIINSGVTPGTNIFEWRRNGGILPGETGPTLSVTQSGTYSLTIYTDYNCQIAYDDILIGYLTPLNLNTPVSKNDCTLLPPPYIFNIDQTLHILNGNNPALATVSYYNSSYNNALNASSNGLIPDADLATYQLNGSTQTIWVRIEDANGCVQVKDFVISASPSPSGNIGYANTSYCTSITASQAIVSTATAGGIYSATPPGLDINPSTGAINPSLSSPGNYTVNYNLAASGNCLAWSPTPTSVTIAASPAAPTVTNPAPYCMNATASALTATGTGLLWYTAVTGGTGSATAPIPSTTTGGNTIYYVSQTVAGCESLRSAITVSVLSAPIAPTVTNPAPYCQSTTATALTATGSNLLWYTAATGGVGSATAPTPSTTAAGNTNYYVSQTVSGCEGPRATITITVNGTPAAPTVINPSPYCQNVSALVLTATGSNLLWYTASTGGVGSATAPTPSTATVGSISYYVSQTISGCEGPRAAIVVTTTAIPSAPTAPTPAPYCQNATASALTATGTGLLWYTAATGGVGSATAPTPSTATAGTTTYYVSQTVSGCESNRTAVTVTINATPTAPTVTNPAPYCQSTTATALTATGSNLLWYTAATGGVGSAIAPTPSTATAGNTTYYVSQTVSGCEGPRAAITVTVNGTPAAPTVSNPAPYCQNVSASVLTATGSNLLWYTASTGGVGSATAPTPSTATVGNITYYVSQTISGCEGPRAAIVVTTTAIPSAPLATAPAPYCQSATASALSATGIGLLWYTAATGGVGSATAPTPSTATAGTTTYYVSQTVSGCESNRTAVTVTINATPVAPTVTNPAPYCQSTTAAVLTATGSNLLWYATATGGVGSATAPTPSTATAGNTAYYVSQTVSGCEGPRAAITVTVNGTPTAPTVSNPAPYCQNVSASVLTATGSNLLWYTASTGGVGSATAPTPSTATVGNITYYVSQTISGCEGPRAAIVVTTTAIPSAPTAPTPAPYCQSATASALSATGTGLLWYTAATGGVGSATAPTPSTATAGTTTYYVSQTVSGCESNRTAVTVTINATPAAPTVTNPAPYCQSTTAAVLTATGSNLLWYASATGGVGSATAPTPSTATAGNTTYYVSQTVSGCEGPRAAITVTVNGTPAAPITAPLGYCQAGIANQLTAIGSNLLWYTTTVGGIGNATAPTPTTATIGTTTYYVSQTINGCEGPRASLVVTVSLTPAAPIVSNPAPYCQNAPAAVLTAIGSNLLWYSNPIFGTGSPTAPTPSTAIAGTIAYYVSQTTNGCEGPRTPIIVTTLATPSAPGVTAVSPYCQNDATSTLSATGSNLLWYTTATGGIGNPIAPTPATLTAGTTTYYVSQTIAGCEGPRASIVITVNATPALPIVSNPAPYCQNTSASILTATGSNLLWYTAAIGGTASTTAPTPSTTIVGNTTFYVSQTINGCEGPRAAIVVTTKAIPAAPIALSPAPYCQNVSAAILSATGSNLLWYTSATSATGSSAAPTPSTSIAGTSNYYVTQTINGCESARTAITVVVLATPSAPIVSNPAPYCQNTTASVLSATGSNLRWYTTATGGTGSAIAPTPSTFTAGNTSYYVSQTIAGCEGPRATITVTVNGTPALPNVSNPAPYCQNTSASILTATGSNLLWYAAPIGGIGSATAPTPSTLSAGNTNYYVSQTINGCEGPRAVITVTVSPTPAAPSVTSVIAYCEGESAATLTASGSGLLWYTSATGGTGSATAPTPPTTTVGSTNYYVSQTTASCEGPRALITVKVNELPMPALLNGTICVDQNNNVASPYVLDTGLGNTGFSFEWYEITATTSVPISGATLSTYSAVLPGVYGVKATNTATGCESDLVKATVIVSPKPELVNVYAAEYFADDQRITINVTPPGNYQYQLDNGALQSGNVFVDVMPGSHTVKVISECGVYPTDVYLMDFPRFFTPNGDGYNDTWNIFALSGQAKAKIYIFDRFGKLLKEISPSGLGWDGKFNQQDMPGSDYWFIVNYEDHNKVSKEFKSHFALKR